MAIKRITLTLLFLSLVCTGTVSAQTGARFGVITGYSMATQYGIDPVDDTFKVDTAVRHGFTGGVFAYFPVTDSVGIQQELLYAMKGSGQDVTISPINTVSDYNLNYFEMPMLVRYTVFKIRNVGIYGSTGIALSLLMNGDYDITTKLVGGPTLLEESGDEKGLDTWDYSFLFGAGADFKFLGRDCFFEYRMTVGWNTLQMPNSSLDPDGGGPLEPPDPVPLRNQNYTFSLGMVF